MAFNQYSTVEPFLRGSAPSWVGGIDATRISSYQTYEQIYWNVQNAFQLSMRGDATRPLYIPAPMQIVEAQHRYLARGMHLMPDPEYGSEQQRNNARVLLDGLLKRERFQSTFSANKRFGIIRGDWLFHFYADPERPEGRRISIETIDPASFFPIFRDDNLDEMIGCYIIEHITDKDGKDPYIKRLKYEKESGTGGPSRILVSDQIFEVDKWGGPGVEQGPEQRADSRFPNFESRKQEPLPDVITSLPVYHIKNFQEPGAPYGSSELRGLERILAGINQAASDEDLTLALDGLGVYATDAMGVEDENGNPIEWNVGPGSVVEVPAGHSFNRVNSSSTMGPYQEHLSYLHDQVESSRGISDVVLGKADVSVAESGIALRLRMDPLLERVRENELGVTDVLVNMFYDLRDWLRAYESEGNWLEQIQWIPIYEDKIPTNKSERFKQIMEMYKERIIDSETARNMLAEIGYEFPQDVQTKIEQEDQRRVDAIGARMDQELGAVSS